MGKRSRSSSSVSSSSSSSSSSSIADGDLDGREEKLRKENRKAVMKRKRQYQTVGDSDESGGSSSDSGSDISSEEESRHRKKRHKKEKKKKNKKHKKEKKKHKHKDKKKSKHKKKSKKASKGERSDGMSGVGSGGAVSMNSFGKYGIIKESDFHKEGVQRSFEAWLGGVKGYPVFTGPKWELMELYKEFCEDFNTATLPHEKYYDYDRWEAAEYNRKKAEAAKSGGVKSDEMAHMESMNRRMTEQKQRELQFAVSQLSKDKIAEMKHQKLLQQEMATSFKTGDTANVERLKKKLEPEDQRGASVKHPWA